MLGRVSIFREALLWDGEIEEQGVWVLVLAMCDVDVDGGDWR